MTSINAKCPILASDLHISAVFSFSRVIQECYMC